MRLVISCVLLGLACSAPVPRIGQLGKTVQTDDGLLVLVPTVPANSEGSDGQPIKREVEYEVIAIPGSMLRREIRQISGLYNAPNVAPAPLINSGIVITPAPFGGSASLGQPGGIYNAPVPAPAKAAPIFGGDAVLSTATNVLDTTGNNLNSIGQATATNAGNVIGFISDVGQGAGSAIAETAGSGLAYAGQLSGALLRSLLQVPAIKARIIGRIIEETQPLTSAFNDVVADSSTDLARSFEANTNIVSDALGLIIRFIQDTLALKGRIIAQIGSSGLDFVPKAIDGTIKIGGAAVESVTGIGRALGDGVGDIIKIGRDANFPTKPALPKIGSFPSLPSLVLPQVDLPSIFPSSPFTTPVPALTPVPVPDASFTPILIPAPAPAPAPVPLPILNPVPAPAPVPTPASAPAQGYEYNSPAETSFDSTLIRAEPEQSFTIVN